MPESRITFDLAKGRIVIEGDNDDFAKLFEMATDALTRASPATTAVPAPQPPAHGNPSAAVGEEHPTVREFARRFSDLSFNAKIVVLLYYATRYANREALTARELEDWFGLCGFRKPKNLSSTLSKAKTAWRYVDRTGRDQWSLATAGENLALDLLESSAPDGS